MEQALADFLRHLGLEKNASAYTVKSYREDLTQAMNFFHERAGSVLRPEQISTRLLRTFVAWLHDQGYARTTISRRIAAVRSWCRFMCRQGIMDKNPADGLRGPQARSQAAALSESLRCRSLLAAPAMSTVWPCAIARSSKHSTPRACASANWSDWNWATWTFQTAWPRFAAKANASGSPSLATKRKRQSEFGSKPDPYCSKELAGGRNPSFSTRMARGCRREVSAVCS